MYKIRNIIIPISKKPDLFKILSYKLHIPVDIIEEIDILRSSLDARQKNHLKFNLTLKAKISTDLKLYYVVQMYKESGP